MATLSVTLEASPSSQALIVPDSSSTLSYAELSRACDAFRAELSRIGLLDAQSSVSMSLINSLEFVVSFISVGLHRCVAAPLNPAYTAQEADFYLTDSKAKLLLVHRGAVQANNEAVKAAQKLGIAVAEVSFNAQSKLLELELKGGSTSQRMQVEGSGKPRPEDVALLLHTSGTTGKPKAVPLSHRNLARTMENIQRTYRLTPQDRTMLVMPLFHVHGLLCGLLAVLRSGGSAVIPPKFAASSFWKHFVKHGCNWYTAVPTIHQILLSTAKPSPMPKIRFIRSCSSALSPATFQQIEEAFNAPVLEAYAMTEAAHQLCANPLPPGKRKPGAVGPGQGVEIRILDDAGNDVPEGEVCARGANITAGYLNNAKANAEAFTKDGFFRTGDRGRLDEDGYVILTGRIKELINKGGEKLSPLEIDGALLAVPGVAEAVCFSVADKKYGEVPWAAVVLKSGTKLTQNEIISAVGKSLAKFKLPERVFLVDSIPKGPTGKVQRRLLGPKFSKLAEQEEGAVKAKL